MNRRAAAALAAATISAASAPAFAEAPGVVASIKPVHSIVSAVMDGVAEPHLIVQGGASPHTYALRPSDAGALQEADVVFWIGEGMETFLEGAIGTLAADAVVIALGAAPGIALLPAREGGVWAEHDGADPADHAEDAYERSAHVEDEEHQADGRAVADRTAGGDDQHRHGAFNMHVWLDPRNAAAMAQAIVAALGAADPDSRARYEANGAALAARLRTLDDELARALAPVRNRPFIVFHDAYQYLEHRYGLNAAGSVTVSPEVQPGAARLREIRRTIRERGAACVFAEPQFPPNTIEVVVEGTGAQTATLDPLGAALDDGPQLYFALMRGNVEALAGCLAATN